MLELSIPRHKDGIFKIEENIPITQLPQKGSICQEIESKPNNIYMHVLRQLFGVLLMFSQDFHFVKKISKMEVKL